VRGSSYEIHQFIPMLPAFVHGFHNYPVAAGDSSQAGVGSHTYSFGIRTWAQGSWLWGSVAAEGDLR